jgi:hypothetical protein
MKMEAANQPGEFMGWDGRMRRWVRQTGESQEDWYRLKVENGEWSEGPHVSEVAAAQAALTALIASEAEAEAWVEWKVQGVAYRALRNGDEVQMWYRERWTIATEGARVAFTKGRKIALAEVAEREERVRELVSYILQTAPAQSHIRDLARELEAKP